MRDGKKAVETRSWSTSHRGPLAIHAAKKTDRQAAGYVSGKDYPAGILGVVELVDCVQMTPALIAATSPGEIAWGDWRVGRFAWMTRPLLWLDATIPCIGRQGLFTLPPDLSALLSAWLRPRGAA